ncbi:MAG: polysaccharide deacetylase family protein, partial [Vicinamibacterales bacterium]
AGCARRNRAGYGTVPGLRLAVLHAEDTDRPDAWWRLIEACAKRFELASPDDLVDLAGGRPPAGDKLLFTMDDGHARTFQPLAQLAQRGIRIIYFVVPSFIGRTAREYLAWHRSRGVDAFNIAGSADLDAARGLAPAQLRELEAMGHLIGAHNDAHRNMAALDEAGIAYEIDGAATQLEELLGHPVEDFAWAFGSIQHAPAAARAAARARYARVYSSIRGLNVPGATPTVLMRDPISVAYPHVFNMACLRGALDHRTASARQRLLAETGRLPREPR